MANTIDIFNSAKLDIAKLTGSNEYFTSLGEITESVKLQNKFISNVDYSDPKNFAKFGLAEEYYKNAIGYITTQFPFDSCTTEKLKWINNLNELEYYIYNKEIPRHAGYVSVSGTQYIGIGSPSRDLADTDVKNVYVNGEKYFVKENLNFSDGFTFESWLNFDQSADSPRILNINTVYSSSGGLSDLSLLKIYTSAGKIYISGSEAVTNFSYDLEDDTWKHYAISINSNSASLFVNGTIQEKLQTSLFANTASNYVFYKLGLIPVTQTSSYSSTGSLYAKTSVFKLGSGSAVSYDETRFWNKERTIEQIGRSWFTSIDGNDFADTNNSSLIFYYKFNEGWNSDNANICLDYSGYRNHSLIYNFIENCRTSGSAINESGIVQDVEQGGIIYAPDITYSQYISDYYSDKLELAKEYDIDNKHSLYKKFPSWILEEEETQDIKHLKQIIQIVSSYFDDLYNKISEINTYKHLKYTEDTDKLYPFYDKILTSAGFDVTDLFNNLDIIEKVSSRTETNIFDENIAKIKNSIFQNIYNNLSYILKSKGTEKSIRSFLRSYGIDENLVRINLYADKSKYTISDKYRETVVKKKTITLTDTANIFLTGAAIPAGEYYTLETSVIFPRKLESTAPVTSSIFGVFLNSNSSSYAPVSGKIQAYLYAEKDDNGYRFCLRTGSLKELVASSSYMSDLYDDTVWNLAIGYKPNVDDLQTAGTNYRYVVDFRAINTYKDNKQYISSSFIPEYSYGNSFLTGYYRYYIGAEKTNMVNSVINNSNAKYLYCNFWSKYLSDYELESHNKDILSYGVSSNSPY